MDQLIATQWAEKAWEHRGEPVCSRPRAGGGIHTQRREPEASACRSSAAAHASVTSGKPVASVDSQMAEAHPALLSFRRVPSVLVAGVPQLHPRLCLAHSRPAECGTGTLGRQPGTALGKCPQSGKAAPSSVRGQIPWADSVGRYAEHWHRGGRVESPHFPFQHGERRFHIAGQKSNRWALASPGLLSSRRLSDRMRHELLSGGSPRLRA